MLGRAGATAPVGIWCLESSLDPSEPLERQIDAILRQLPSLDSVQALPEDWDVDVFVGLFLGNVNEGLGLSAELLHRLGVAGIRLGFDIYSFLGA